MLAHFLVGVEGNLYHELGGDQLVHPLSISVKYSSVLHLKDYHIHETLPRTLVVLCLAHRGC